MKIKKEIKLTTEEIDVLRNLKSLKNSLDIIHQNFEYVTDEKLIDGYIYEIISLNAKYSYYIKLCKEKKLTSKDMANIAM
ncbi:MAG: DUF2508 family protein [Lachnospirales bacterium]